MKDEIKEILEALKPQDEEFTKAGIKEYPLHLRPDQQKILLDYITNLQTIEQQYSAILSENAELENKITNLQEENEKLNSEKELFYKISEERLNKWLKLNEENNELVEIIKKYSENYKSRIDKAIGFIKANTEYYSKMCISGLTDKECETLLDVLQGSDKE